MAEVAIPLAALGIMYIISNKENNKKEGFHTNQRLPNEKLPVKNYPNDTKKDLLNETNVQTYSGYKNKNDNLFQPSGYKKAMENNSNSLEGFTSLTGENVQAKDLEHNNMVPFFGSKITQNTGSREMKVF